VAQSWNITSPVGIVRQLFEVPLVAASPPDAGKADGGDNGSVAAP